MKIDMLVKQSPSNTLELVRSPVEYPFTLGRLYYCGKFLCYTLEPYLHDGMRFHAVLPASYNLLLTPSPRFNYVTPELIVPGRSGVRIHIGNYVSQTKGCILVGRDYNNKGLLGSRIAFKELMSVIRAHHISFIDITSKPF